MRCEIGYVLKQMVHQDSFGKSNCPFQKCNHLCFQVWICEWNNDRLLNKLMRKKGNEPRLIDIPKQERDKGENMYLFWKWLNEQRNGVPMKMIITLIVAGETELMDVPGKIIDFMMK